MLNFPGLDLIWWILILVFLNFFCIALIRSEERFWLPHMISWILLCGLLVFNNTLNRGNVIQKELIYQQQTNPDSQENYQATLDLDAAKKAKRSENVFFIRLLGLQSLIGFFTLLSGYRNSMKKVYKKGAISFLLLFILYFAFEIIQLFILTSRSDSNI